MSKEKNKGGRPVKYKNAAELDKIIEKYFGEIDAHNKKWPLSPKHPTITGLALALDLTRQGLIEYSEKDEEFSDTIKRAKAVVEEYLEQRLYYQNATGSIFNLKNNFGWKDKTETEISNPEGRPFETKNVSDDNLDSRIAELLNKAREAGTSKPAGGAKKPKGKK